MPITSFSGQYRFLSNFWPVTVVYLSRMFDSAEHAYQAAKASNLEDLKYVKDAPTAAEAKRRGRNIEKSPDFEFNKLDIMKEIVRLKFAQNPNIAKLLLATGDEELIEGNYWNDRFWGQCPVGVGHNHLGRILMEVRKELSAASHQSHSQGTDLESL